MNNLILLETRSLKLERIKDSVGIKKNSHVQDGAHACKYFKMPTVTFNQVQGYLQ